MKITGSSWTMSSKDDYSSYVKQLNANYNKLKIRAANRLTSQDNSNSKMAVAISPELLKQTTLNENAADQLDKKLTKLGDAQKAFASLNQYGLDVTVKGYTFDRRGNITVHGTDNKTSEEFEINLGKISDGGGYQDKIYEHFNLSATDLFLFTIKNGI